MEMAPAELVKLDFHLCLRLYSLSDKGEWSRAERGFEYYFEAALKMSKGERMLKGTLENFKIGPVAISDNIQALDKSLLISPQ